MQDILSLNPYYQYFLDFKGEDSKNSWCIVTYPSIGDAYIICSLLKSFIEYHKPKYGADEVLVMMTRPGFTEIFRLFEKDIAKGSAIDASHIDIYKACRSNIFTPGIPLIIHPFFIGDGRSHHFLGHRKINMTDIYRYLLQIPLDTPMLKPNVRQEYTDSARDLFRSLNLPEGQTAILAPYARSHGMMPLAFWVLLANRLSASGWTVCTNTDSKKPPIPGTTAISFSLGEAIPFCELAGWVISTRSGLCDLLCTANCKLSVIYHAPVEQCVGGILIKDMINETDLNGYNLDNDVKEYAFSSDCNFEEACKMLLK